MLGSAVVELYDYVNTYISKCCILLVGWICWAQWLLSQEWVEDVGCNGCHQSSQSGLKMLSAMVVVSQVRVGWRCWVQQVGHNGCHQLSQSGLKMLGATSWVQWWGLYGAPCCPVGHDWTTMSPESNFFWWISALFSSHCLVVIPVIFQPDNLSTRLSDQTVQWTWPDNDWNCHYYCH